MAITPTSKARAGRDAIVEAVEVRPGVITDSPVGEPVATIVLHVDLHAGNAPAMPLRLHIPTAIAYQLAAAIPEAAAAADENRNELRVEDDRG